MKNFVLPGFYENFTINSRLVLLFEENPQWFRENVKLECFFGAFQFCAWDGGRVFGRYDRAYKEDIARIRDFYNEHGLPIRLTFTNPEITLESLKDPYCNMVLYELNNGMNEVLVTSPLLEEYIRTNYSQMKICSSTTKCITSPKLAKEELNKNYHQVCLDYNLNHNEKFLSGLTQEEKDKTEILCNAICPPGCPFRKEHYRLNGLANLNGNSTFSIECQINGTTMDENVWAYHNNLTPEDIEEYEEKGFSHFKLEGRTIPEVEIVSNYCRYLIKPEYHLRFMYEMLI
jgi:collagenase-like PrtC family protease